MQLVPLRPRYKYPTLKRVDAPTGRYYQLRGTEDRLSSVTTILSATKDRGHLDSWAARVGEEEATRIRVDAALVGTHMHSVIERLLLNRDLPPPRTWLAAKGYWMGYKLLEEFFPYVDEVWGSEANVYSNQLRYAGTTDCVGVYRSRLYVGSGPRPSIIDFKQANKLKERKWIEDYFVQLASYAVAHNENHGTEINQGVIMMVSQDGQTKEFVSCGREFEGYKDQWKRRVEAFHKKGPSLVSPDQIATTEGDTPD